MKLTNYIIDLGRVVAYYPNLKKVTESTTSSILLCQLLYWSNKTKDGWIWKNSEEIEEETGLTYNEQKTARRTLVDLGLLEEENKRLSHSIRFRINQDALNARWEKITGDKTEPIVKEEAPVVVPIVTPVAPVEGTIEASFMKPLPPVEPRRTAVEKKGDMLDALLDAEKSPGMQKMRAKISIKQKIEKKFGVIADDKRWDAFIEFVHNRQEKENQSIERFIDWAIQEGFNAMYWSPEKMKTLWPQAFIKADNSKPREDFVEKLPEKKEEECAPMPTDIGRKRELY
jgi:hypothetical protein